MANPDSLRLWNTLATQLEDIVDKAPFEGPAADGTMSQRVATVQDLIERSIKSHPPRQRDVARLPSAPGARRDLLGLLLGAKPSLYSELSMSYSHEPIADSDVESKLQELISKGLLDIPKD